MKIVSVVGARPQFIKMGALSAVLRRHFQEILVHTGQHYDASMSDIFFETLGLPRPDHHLGVGSGSHGAQTGAMLARMDEVLLREKPDLVVVFGDTNSTLAGALAAAKLDIPVAHVEAGLRSYTAMPEEINRRVVDHVSALLFTPTETANRNLAREAVPGEVHLVGDILVEAVQRVLSSGGGDGATTTAGQYWLVTLHRAALTADATRLQAVLQRLDLLDGDIVFPMHPRTGEAIGRAGLQVPRRVRVVPPAGFLEMIHLQQHARGIVTDSGGVQREAYLLGVPCFLVRDETEWPETEVHGWNRRVGADAAGLADALARPRPNGERPPVFGDGHTGERIAKAIENYCCAAHQ